MFIAEAEGGDKGDWTKAIKRYRIPSGAKAWAGRTCLLDRGGFREGGGCPSPFPGRRLGQDRAGLGRGLAGNVSHPELGHGCSRSRGAV